MLIIPMDPTRTLIAMGKPIEQMNRETNTPAVDRQTNVPLMDVQVVMPTDDGQPLAMRVTVPITGLADPIDLGARVKATGLTLITDVKNGKAWYVYKASALTVTKG